MSWLRNHMEDWTGVYIYASLIFFFGLFIGSTLGCGESDPVDKAVAELTPVECTTHTAGDNCFVCTHSYHFNGKAICIPAHLISCISEDGNGAKIKYKATDEQLDWWTVMETPDQIMKCMEACSSNSKE